MNDDTFGITVVVLTFFFILTIGLMWFGSYNSHTEFINEGRCIEAAQPEYSAQDARILCQEDYFVDDVLVQ